VIILNVRKIILVVAILALIVPSLFMFSKGEVTDNTSFSESFMEDVRVANRGLGKVRWVLNAKRVVIEPGGKSSQLQNVSINIPEQKMDVTSDTGLFDLERRNLTLAGNVEATTRGYVLRTESVLLNSDTNAVSSEDRVVLEGNKFKIEGDGFHTNGEKKVTIDDNVRATFF
jgi:LPS export ABC transporter protein LptC